MTKVQDREKKAILLVEDNEFLGQNMVDGFRDRGFTAYHATSPDDAFKYLERLDHPPDVTVLDMNLEADLSGADVGMAILKKFREKTPEFIIYSAYHHKNYYRAAFDLKAGIYLHKTDEDYRVVITNARVLAIRRAVRNCSKSISRVVATSNTIGKAMERCLNELLLPQFQACLGANHFLLFSEHSTLKILGVGERHSESLPIWRELQDEVFRRDELVTPIHLLESLLTWPDERLQQQMEGAVIMPLYQNNGFKIALVIEDASGSLGERAQPLTEALAYHCRSAIVEHFFMAIYTQYMTESEKSKREQVQMAARLCFYVGKRQEELYDLAVRADEIRPGAVTLPRLKILSRELNLIGNQMQIMDEEKELDQVSFKELVINEWKDLVIEKQAPEEMLNTDALEDDWLVLANKGSLSLGIKRILVWMINRRDKHPDGKTPSIRVEPKSYESGFCHVVFRDFSERLPKEMLRDLFKPFSTMTMGKHVEDQLGLFQAKMLIEVANNGRLWERPHEEPGHVLEMRLHTP